jgi:hypothetical protein
MKVAKNMDSVFSNCTDKEVEFDIFFDDDDTIIDILSSVDEYSMDLVEEEDDMVGENPDFEYQDDDSNAPEEGTKEDKLEVGGEVGDGKEVSGKENSAESDAYDTSDEEDAIGFNDKQQRAMEGTMYEDAAEGPLEDDDPAEREGEVSDDVVETEASLLDLLEDTDPIEDTDDADSRDGKDTGVDDTEGKNTEVLGASIVGDVSKDVLIDLDDADARDGKDTGVDDTEGVKSHVVGAALEAEDILRDLMEAEEENKDSGDVGNESDEEVEKDEKVSEATDEEENTQEEKDDAPDEDAEESCKESAPDVSTSEDIKVSLESTLLDLLEDTDDADARDGKDTGVDDTEGKNTEVLGASINGDSNEDPIKDPKCPNDSDVRDGSTTGDTKDVEGVNTHVVGAALEADDFVDDLLDDLDGDDDLIASLDNEVVVSDKIKQQITDDADIEVKESADSLLDLLEETEAEKLTDPKEEDDDADIEAVDNDEIVDTSDTEYDYEYEDDELIDAVANGLDLD